MAVEKIINALVSDIKSDLDPNFFGAFGFNYDRIAGRLEDLSIIAKTIHDNVLLKQIKKADNDLIDDNNDKVVKDLSNLVVEAK